MRRLWGWGLKAGLSIVDQGLVSLSNFALSIVLARLLSAEEYGAFSVSLTVFLVIAGLHNALIIEPMSVLGPARYSAALPGYLQRMTWLHLALMAILAVVGMASALFFWRTPMGPTLFSMSLCCPVLLLFWLFRRAHYLDTRPDLAARASGIYFVTLVMSVLALKQTNLLSASSAFYAMAAASLFASVFSMMQMRIFYRAPAQAAIRNTALESWHFGKWIIPGTLLYPLLAYVQLFFTGMYLGLGPAGVLRALQNPVLPVIQVGTALATLAIPQLAREFSTGGARAVYARGAALSAFMGLFALVYEIAILASGNLWDSVFYGGRYSQYDFLMPVMGTLPIFTGIAGGCMVIMRAVQKPELTTVNTLFGAVFGACTTYFFIVRWQLTGAVYGLVGAQAITALAGVLIVGAAYRSAQRATPQPAAAAVTS